MPPPDRARRIDPKDRAQLDAAPVPLRRVLSLFRGHEADMLTVTIMIVATSVIGLGQPFLVREVVDVAIPRQDVRILVWSVVGMVAIAVVTQVLGILQTWISARLGQRVMHALRTSVFTHLQRQSLGFFIRSRGGEVQSRIVNDVNGLNDVVTNTATSIATNLTTTVATAIAMVALSWKLSLLTLVVMPPAVLLTRHVALTRRAVMSEQQAALADLTTQIEEGLSASGVRLAKTLGADRHNAARFASTSSRLIDLELRAQLAGRWRMGTMQVMFAVIPALVYLAAGLPGTGEVLTIGTLVAFVALQASVFRPLMGLLNVGAQVVSSMALFSRIFEYLDLVPEVPAPVHPVRIPHPRGEVRLNDVSYRYAGADRDALHHVSAVVPAGGSLAVVGHTGSGKSTLAALVARLYDPTQGSVTIDGVDVRRIDADQLSRLVGVVSQETYLLHTTIRENLLLASPDASDGDLWAALETAQIAAHVASLPEGLDTVVGSRGHRFSGGEQQRLAVARTILRDPPVLVLDEATSALDNATEAALQSAIDALARGRTTITIAHRMSTIADADSVLVLDAGEVVEQGRPGDLALADGAFSALAHAQHAV
ncbi:MAG TPA: ABC transporter ATP-binding protein [Propionibacteriaceae bacterium]|nr:ABC transporter ATP-binding protein [Propionibacteriaceae bacterium]